MKSQIMFLQTILLELGEWCRISTTQDVKTVLGRIKEEGDGFLTIALPNFGKDLERALDQGFVGSDQFAGFKRTGGLPRFLGGFLSQIFDSSTGRLLPDPSVLSIWAIRQFTLMWAKIAIPCSEERVKAALKGYVANDANIHNYRATISPDLWEDYRRLGRLLWSDVFQGITEDILYFRIIPKHGPGATAEKLTGNRKWLLRMWTQRLEAVFPHWEFLSSSWSLSLDRFDSMDVREPGAEQPVRVISVPKTQKTPRIIAIEPTCMQYMQQGLLRSFVNNVRADNTARSLIGWESQEHNRVLAQSASRDGSLATLDLSEASDRVDYLHVLELLQHFSTLKEAIDATRSRKADVPGHGEIHLNKYASMGSALCFPIEAMVFCTIVFLGIQNQLKRPLTKKDIQSFVGSVRVYGDDIIVPADYMQSVVRSLEAFGLLVNRNKSFGTGKFRESCGGDFYDGEDVSVVRVREELPTDRRNARRIVAAVSLRNELYLAGLWRSTRWMDKLLEDLRIPLPIVQSTSPVLGRTSFLPVPLSGDGVRMCSNYHRPLVYGYVVAAKSPKSFLDDYGALHKCLTLMELSLPSKKRPHGLGFEWGDPVSRNYIPGDSIGSYLSSSLRIVSDARHLEQSGRPFAVDIKRRWAPPY